MKAKEWLEIIKQADDYNPEMTSLIEKYGEILLAEQKQNEEIQDLKLVSLIKVANNCTPYTTKTKDELIQILKNNGSDKFLFIENCIFSLDEFGIIKGIGFNEYGHFKVWNNRNFGVFK